MKWPLAKLEDVALQTKGAIVSGPFGSNIGSRFFVDEGVPIIRGNNLTFGQRHFIDDGFVYLTEAKAQEFRNCEAVADDLVFTAAGTIGQVGIIPKDARFERYIISNKQLRVRCDQDKVSPLFLFFWLTTDEMRLHIIGRNTGGAVPLINLGILRGLPVPLPPIEVQQRIADILSAYDDLIENNRRRMALLEEAARQLYREWFVRLRFPGHEHTRITDGVPEGWERKPVDQLTSFLSRGIAPHYDDDAEGLVINQKCIRGGRLDLSLARRQMREFKPERQVQHGDVLVNSTGEGTLGRVAQALEAIENCTVDTHVTIVRPTPDIGIYYFGQALMEWEPRFSTMGRGATNQTELSRAQIGEVEILVPQRSLVQQFEEAAKSALRQVWVLMEQSDKLRAARDLLLPRLMSGEIAV